MLTTQLFDGKGGKDVHLRIVKDVSSLQKHNLSFNLPFMGEELVASSISTSHSQTSSRSPCHSHINTLTTPAFSSPVQIEREPMLS